MGLSFICSVAWWGCSCSVGVAALLEDTEVRGRGCSLHRERIKQAVAMSCTHALQADRCRSALGDRLLHKIANRSNIAGIEGVRWRHVWQLAASQVGEAIAWGAALGPGVFGSTSMSGTPVIALGAYAFLMGRARAGAAAAAFGGLAVVILCQQSVLFTRCGVLITPSDYARVVAARVHSPDVTPGAAQEEKLESVPIHGHA